MTAPSLNVLFPSYELPVVNVANIAALRALPSANLTLGSFSIVDAVGMFLWSPTSNVADDSSSTIKPTDVGGGANGRWLSTSGNADQIATDDGILQTVIDALQAADALRPTSATLAGNGGAALIKTASGITVQAALNSLSGGSLAGPLAEVTSPAPPETYDLPANFNDIIGGTKVVHDGVEWRFERSRFNALDFTLTATSITHLYVNWTTGSDSDSGLTSADAVKTFGKALEKVAALPADSNAVIHLEEESVGYNSVLGGVGFSLSHNECSGRNVKIIGEGPSGFTRMLVMREDYTEAGFAWTAHGSNGAWKSNASVANRYVSQFWTKDLDAEGIPAPIINAANAAAVETTELTSFWDGTYLYVHLPKGAKPKPFVNWIYCNNAGAHQFNTDSGTLLFENVDFQGGSYGAAFNCARFRSTTVANVNSQARLGFKKCRFYGSSANGLGTFDIKVVVTEQCSGAYCFNDIFNFHSFNLNSNKGKDTTCYEDRARGHDAGYTGFNWNLTASGSDNGSTCHDGISMLRAGSRFWRIKDCAVVDVGGCDSVNFGVTAPVNLTGASSYYPASITYEALSGEGLRRRMVLIGCAGFNGASDYSLRTVNGSGDARIEVQYWRGDPAAACSGKVIAYPSGTVLNS